MDQTLAGGERREGALEGATGLGRALLVEEAVFRPAPLTTGLPEGMPKAAF